MELEALPAAKGDCLLLHHELDGQKRLVLIDGGPGGVYPKTLKPRLLKLRKTRIADGDIAEEDPLFIDLVIISHIDDDHINGILALLQDMSDGERRFRIGRIWHNSFATLLDAAPPQAIARVLNQADDGDPDRHDLGMIIASVPQGNEVLKLAKKLGISVNPEFDSKPMLATDGKPHAIDGFQITVLGPMEAELKNLRKLYADWLKEHDAGTASIASLIASFKDTSVPNLASIVLLIEKDGQRFLLTGDARGDKIMKAAKELNLLHADQTLPVDIFKVPHHGSDRNNAANCFRMFPAPHYVFSGDGHHGNPERETFVYLVEARGTVPLTVELTYSPDAIDVIRAAEWKKDNAAPFDLQTQGVSTYLPTQPTLTIRHP